VDKNKVIASISEDKRIFKNCLNGEELDFKVKEIGKLADFLEEDRKKEGRKINRESSKIFHRQNPVPDTQ